MKNSYKKIISVIGLATVVILFWFSAFSQDIDGGNAFSSEALKSSKVFEGQVVEQVSFYNSSKTHIYTKNTIKVFKSWESEITADYVEIISLGGVIGNEMEAIIPSNPVNVNDIGIFSAEKLNSVNWKLNFLNTIQINPTTIYQNINEAKNKSFTTINPNPRIYNAKKGNAKIKIDDFFPKELAAGTGDTLTIKGKGFGPIVGFGYVLFKNNNDGGATYTMPSYKQIVFWNDTLIKVLVPNNAGTGSILVVNSNDEKTEETLNPLSVKYSIYNTTYRGNYYIPTLVNDNNQGGYDVASDVLLGANPLLLGDLTNSINNWNCKTGANINIKENGILNKAERDGKNLFKMSALNELPSNMLALTIGYYNGCENGEKWFLKEFDMIINSNYKWALGNAIPGHGKYDLKTVLLHELGHVLQMGHSNNVGNIMYPSLKDGDLIRGLKENNAIQGVEFSTNYSKTHSNCSTASYTEKFFADCSENNTGFANNTSSDNYSIFPNPSNGIINITSTLPIEKVELYTIQGLQLVSIANLSQEKNIRIDLTNENLNKGYYFLKIISNEHTQVDKTFAFSR